MNTVAIGDSNLKIADGNYSAKYPRSEEFVSEGVPFIRGNNFENKSISDKNMYFISPEKHSELKKGHVKPKDVLITTRGNIGKVALVPERHDDSNINSQLVLLRCNEGWHPEYLLHTFNSKFVTRQIPALITGSALKQLSVKNLKKLKIPLPPLDQQKKIAAILDAADAYRQKTKALIDKYDELTQSLFLEMFGDLSLKNTKWDILKIREVIIEYKSGASIKPAEFTQNGFPVLHKGAIKTNGGILVDSKKKAFVSLDACIKYKNSIVDKKYLVVTLRDLVPTGPSIGLISHLKHFEIDQYILAQGAYGLLLNEKLVNPTYMVHWSNSPIYRGELSKYWVGSTQIHLRSSMFFDLDMPVPNIELQNQFAERVQAIETQKAQSQASLAQAEDLFNSLLQKAFKGELF